MAAGRLTLKTVTIPSGDYTHATPLDLRYHKVSALMIPADWTEAEIVFAARFDGVTYEGLGQATTGYLLKLRAAANRSFNLPSSWFTNVNWLYLISGDPLSGGTVNQAADRLLTLVCLDKDALNVVVEEE